MKYIFVLTFTITLLNSINILSHTFGKRIVVYPHFKKMDVREWFMFYPSLLYQVYWWGIYFHLIN